MLPEDHRMRRPADFSTVLRGGRRARGRLVIVHHAALRPAGADVPAGPALVGLVVSRAVGMSVVRHAVSRRLRHQLRPQLPGLADGTGTVVRALPAAAHASSAELARDLDRALARATRA